MDMENRVLTGITPTGQPHLGNYLGMIQPALAMSQKANLDCFYFIADYHSLIKLHDPSIRKQAILEVTASWLALGLNPVQTFFYRQSDVPEIMELTWILNNVTAKGLLNRAHAYKAKLDENDGAKDPDAGIVAGLYQYPILMAADILIFDANCVPVGKDQIQHIEITRDIALRFNHLYGQAFTPPSAFVNDKAPVLLGLDGRKMSKSYGNTIPLFCDDKRLRKLINKIKTNSQLPGEPKDPNNCMLFDLYSAFATPTDIDAMLIQYQEGIGWGDMKKILFEKLNAHLEGPRQLYHQWMSKPNDLHDILKQGASRVHPMACNKLQQVRDLVGI